LDLCFASILAGTIGPSVHNAIYTIVEWVTMPSLSR
jgi:hypothetical protein